MGLKCQIRSTSAVTSWRENEKGRMQRIRPFGWDPRSIAAHRCRVCFYSERPYSERPYSERHAVTACWTARVPGVPFSRVKMARLRFS